MDPDAHVGIKDVHISEFFRSKHRVLLKYAIQQAVEFTSQSYCLFLGVLIDSLTQAAPRKMYTSLVFIPV